MNASTNPTGNLHGRQNRSAQVDAASVRVRRSIHAHITPKPGYVEFLSALAADPIIHHTLSPDLAFDPEVVFTIDMQTDSDGFTHALQKRPDGTADYIRYHPSRAPICIRWICRTPDQDAIGIAFPSTSEVEGHTTKKAKGQVISLDGGKAWRIDMRMGLLTSAETKDMTDHISRIRYTNLPNSDIVRARR